MVTVSNQHTFRESFDISQSASCWRSVETDRHSLYRKNKQTKTVRGRCLTVWKSSVLELIGEKLHLWQWHRAAASLVALPDAATASGTKRQHFRQSQQVPRLLAAALPAVNECHCHKLNQPLLTYSWECCGTSSSARRRSCFRAKWSNHESLTTNWTGRRWEDDMMISVNWAQVRKAGSNF